MVGWTAVVVALSAVIIAGALVVLTIGHLTMAREIERASNELTKLLETLDRDARPALNSVRTAAEDAGRIAVLLRKEVEGIAGTSESLRARVERTASSLEERFEDLQALADVLQDEVEDTVLDVAAALRTTRRGAGILRTMKRALRRR